MQLLSRKRIQAPFDALLQSELPYYDHLTSFGNKCVRLSGENPIFLSGCLVRDQRESTLAYKRSPKTHSNPSPDNPAAEWQSAEAPFLSRRDLTHAPNSATEILPTSAHSTLRATL